MLWVIRRYLRDKRYLRYALHDLKRNNWRAEWAPKQARRWK